MRRLLVIIATVVVSVSGCAEIDAIGDQLVTSTPSTQGEPTATTEDPTVYVVGKPTYDGVRCVEGRSRDRYETFVRLCVDETIRAEVAWYGRQRVGQPMEGAN